jgi:putative nucleotidyltransferase with HDIG domain
MKNQSRFKSLNVDGFWRHSIGVGVAAKLIADAFGIPTNLKEEYFIGGLLHDIGKIPLNEIFDEEYLKVIRTADMKKVPLIEMENEMLGVNHTEVGKMIAEKWRLSPETYECILNHHEPDVGVLDKTGVTEEFLDNLFDTISEEVEKASIFLHVSG